MTKQLIHCTSLSMILCALSIAAAQAQTTTSAANDTASRATGKSEFQFMTLLAKARGPRSGFSLARSTNGARASAPLFTITPAASGPALPVLGAGTLGRLTKWTGLTSSNSFIGDTTIFEDKNGLVGIGTDTPTSRLTVAGTIQSLSGGFKFPDGTVQMTAGVAPTQVVTSLNGLTGNVTLQAGSNIAITPSGNTLTIAAPNTLSSIAHDGTLRGNGTSGSPLGVAVPLSLFGSGTAIILEATNTTVSGDGMRAEGGHGGNGVDAIGGDGASGPGGAGVLAKGGSAGGDLPDQNGGIGVDAQGGDSNTAAGFGGIGVQAQGGIGNGLVQSGGIGIVAKGGSGINRAIHGLAGLFEDDVVIEGGLIIVGNLGVVGTKNFKIDHPLDPENKYLYHASIESSEVLNIYSGNVTTDKNGEAVVTLPEWFEAINRDFRYQLTVVGTFAQAIVANKIKANRFTVKTNAPNIEVSWQVTGVRSDARLRKHPFRIEEDKPDYERGYYLSPEAYEQPEERGIEWARNPQLMQSLKQRRLEEEQKLKTQPHSSIGSSK